MAATLPQFTGSNNDYSTVTQSTALDSDVLTNNYQITQDATQFTTHISKLQDQRGTHGNSYEENVNLYLHQRQENIIRYSHGKDGYDYIFIKPSDIRLRANPPANAMLTHYPGAVKIPAGFSGFAEFRVPKNAVIYTGAKVEEKIFCQMSASAAHLIKGRPMFWALPQELNRNTPLLEEAWYQANKQLDVNLPLDIAFSGGYNTELSIKYPLNVNKMPVRGQDTVYWTFLIPAGRTIAQHSDKLFYGARIPIKIA